MTKFSQEAFRTLLDALSEGKSMAQSAALACSSRSKIAWVWIRNSKKEKDANTPLGDCKYVVRDWPEENEHHHLCDAFQMAQQIAKLDMHLETLAEIRQSTRPVLEGGREMYEVDHEAIALYQGDADVARLCGVHDPFFRHDPVTGARIPLRVRDRTSAALTIKALQAVDPERWARPEEINVNKKTVAVFTISGERKPTKQPSELEQDLRSRLAAIRAAKAGERVTAPNAPVQVMGRGNDGPTERTSTPHSDDAANPLPPEPPRALPPPRRDPQEPQVSYARPSQKLDLVNRKTPMPSGGFSVTRNNRPT